jgi:molecular chaperone DnaK (HSP70)
MFAGFDYGTSNCSIGLVREGQVRLVPLEDDDPLIPSTLYAPRPQLQLERSVADIRGLDVNDAVISRTSIRSCGARRLSRCALRGLLHQESEEFSRRART